MPIRARPGVWSQAGRGTGRQRTGDCIDSSVWRAQEWPGSKEKTSPSRCPHWTCTVFSQLNLSTIDVTQITSDCTPLTGFRCISPHTVFGSTISWKVSSLTPSSLLNFYSVLGHRSWSLGPDVQMTPRQCSGRIARFDLAGSSLRAKPQIDSPVPACLSFEGMKVAPREQQ